MRVPCEGLEEYVWKNDVGCLLTRKFSQERQKKKLRKENKREMSLGHKLYLRLSTMRYCLEEEEDSKPTSDT